MSKKVLMVPPLNGAYMASSMLGFLISIIYVYNISKPWGLAFAITFMVMFLSAVKSMTYADPTMFVEVENMLKENRKPKVKKKEKK